MAPRKTKAADVAEETTVAPVAEPVAEPVAAPITEGRIESKAAPLEAPVMPTKVETPSDDAAADSPQHAGNLGSVMVRNAVPGSRLIDQRTDATPDPETLFAPAEGAGVFVTCTVRLCQDTWIGPHEAPIRQLVMAQGTVTSQDKAAPILAALRAQIEADTALADAETVEAAAAE